MRLFIAMLVFGTLCSTTNAFSKPVPEAVIKAAESVYTVCDVLEVTSAWSDSNGQVDTRKIPGIECGVGFQVSPTEIITAAHVVPHPINRLVAPGSGYLIKQFLSYQHWGFYMEPGIPLGALRVSSHREFTSAEGQVFKTPKILFEGKFDGEPTKLEYILDLARDFIQGTAIIADNAEALINPDFEDSDRDLALFVLKYPVQREVYIEVDETTYAINTLTWGLKSRKAGPFDNGVPPLGISSGTIKATHQDPGVSYWPLGQGVWTYQVFTDDLNVSGNSGSPDVSFTGKLVGVTHAAPASETIMANFDLQFRCNVPRADGSYLPCHRWIIPGHVVHQFLEEARNGSGPK